MSRQVDGQESFSVSVGTGNSDGSSYSREIEEDVFHKAVLVDIELGTKTYKGNESPAWVWIYELQGEEFSYEYEGEMCQRRVVEKTSRKFTKSPHQSTAYKRYCALMGVKELDEDETVNLKEDLLGTKCKLMITNKKYTTNDGEERIYNKIEKVSVKGISQDDEEEEEVVEKKKTKKKKASKKKNTKKAKKEEQELEEDTDVADEILSDLEDVFD